MQVNLLTLATLLRYQAKISLFIIRFCLYKSSNITLIFFYPEIEEYDYSL